MNSQSDTVTIEYAINYQHKTYNSIYFKLKCSTKIHIYRTMDKLY